VIPELNQLNSDLREVSRDITNMKVEIGRLQVKAGVWGFSAGLFAVLIVLLLHFVGGIKWSPRWSLAWSIPMATTLAPVDSREVVRCDHCLLVQFRTVNNNCRRCHSSLDEEPEPEPVVFAPPIMMPMPGMARGHLNLATSIRSLRLRSGLSQRQLAGRMSVPRTYVSKVENEKETPSLGSLERLARALEVTVPELLSGGEKNRQDEISELIKDPFIAELLPFVSQLVGMQMSSILTQVRDLTIRPRRTA
jgi:transcriptional regulator with XRE-family HTH domain